LSVRPGRLAVGGVLMTLTASVARALAPKFNNISPVCDSVRQCGTPCLV